MHVQARLVATRFDLYFRPLARHEVYVALVLLRELLAQSVPREVRVRDVLGRMVPPLLIVGAAIGRAQVEAFVLCGVFGGVKVDAEGHADESPRPASRIGGGFARQFDFDHAVLKFRLIQNDELNSIRDVGRRRVSHTQRFSPLVGHLFRLHIAELHLARTVQWNGCGLDLCKPHTQRQRQSGGQDKHRLFHQLARMEAQVLPKSLHSFSPCRVWVIRLSKRSSDLPWLPAAPVYNRPAARRRRAAPRPPQTSPGRSRSLQRATWTSPASTRTRRPSRCRRRRLPTSSLAPAPSSTRRTSARQAPCARRSPACVARPSRPSRRRCPPPPTPTRWPKM